MNLRESITSTLYSDIDEHFFYSSNRTLKCSIHLISITFLREKFVHLFRPPVVAIASSYTVHCTSMIRGQIALLQSAQSSSHAYELRERYCTVQYSAVLGIRKT